MTETTYFGRPSSCLLASRPMSDLAALLAFIHQVSGTPYISGGDTARGTDCSGLASWVANVATDRPAFGSRFNTGNQERALLARGFKYGTALGALVIGWNGGHTAVTLPDGTAVSSGEGGGVRIGGGGAYQPQFKRHMYLPMDSDDAAGSAPLDVPADAEGPEVIPASVLVPQPESVPADEAPAQVAPVEI
ncbi:hypothetical protein [Mycobacteroides abscessus]|uniref:hypothetical protein n=1 Tax=Mycobacteroides abscessus TaxID=36809 RepID=UPI003743A29E